MKKRGMAVCALLLCLALTGCGRWGIFSHELEDWMRENSTDGGAYSADSDSQADSGGETYYGELGDTMSSCFFDFTVKNARLRSEYGGYAAQSGMQLLDVLVTVRNTYHSELPMSIYDFQVQWGEEDDAFGYEADAFWNGADTMPEQYALAEDEERTMHIVYEVPLDREEFSVSYREQYDGGGYGNTFFVFFSMDDAGMAAASGTTGV